VDLSQLPFEFTTEEKRVGMSGLEQKYLGAALRNIGDPSSPDWPVGVAKSYDNVTMTEFLREQGASMGAIQLLDLPFATASDDRISFLFNLREAWYASHEKTARAVRSFGSICELYSLAHAHFACLQRHDSALE
jgi:hypothetical protein